MPERRRYLLAGLLVCGTCGRRMESAWSHGRAAYRCRHGHTSAAPPDPAQPVNAYVREDRALAYCPPSASGWRPPRRRRRRTRRGTDVRPAASPEEVAGYLRANEIAVTYDQATGILRASANGTAKTIARKAG